MNRITVDLKTGIFNPLIGNVAVRQERGSVVLLIADKRIDFNTPAAHKAGFAMVKKSAEALNKEFIEVSINSEPLHFTPEHAKQIGSAILRKADAADDFQISTTTKQD